MPTDPVSKLLSLTVSATHGDGAEGSRPAQLERKARCRRKLACRVLAAVLTAACRAPVHAGLPDVTTPGDPIVPTSNNSPASAGVANAIDDQPSTKYLNFDRLNAGLTVIPRLGLTIVSGLTLTSANDAPEQDPASYQLAGSYDGTTFTLIAQGSVAAFPARFFKHAILFDNKVPYLRYRLVFPTVAGPGGTAMQIAEVELLGAPAPTDVTLPGDPIVPTSNNSPASAVAANAIDNQPAKYLNFDTLNSGLTVTPRVGNTIVIGLTLTSADDAPERDPASYTLHGSNDGANFFPISSGSVPAFPTRSFKHYLLFANNTQSFRSYRLIFPTVAGPGAIAMQIAEVELLGVPEFQTVLDHFFCYETKPSKGAPKFATIPGVHIVTSYDDVSVDVKKPRELCPPADKNGGGLRDPATHLESYQIKPVKDAPKYAKLSGLVVINQLGELSLDAVKRDFLLVPTAKSLTSPPPAPSPAQHDVSHFACYKVKISKGAAKFPKGVQVVVGDQFTDPAKRFDVKRPTRICAPADKNGEPRKSPAVHLLCYKVALAKADPKQPKHVQRTNVLVNNQFGPGTLDTVAEDELCVPSVTTP